jgi:hypothetical protein
VATEAAEIGAQGSATTSLRCASRLGVADRFVRLLPPQQAPAVWRLGMPSVISTSSNSFGGWMYSEPRHVRFYSNVGEGLSGRHKGAIGVGG